MVNKRKQAKKLMNKLDKEWAKLVRDRDKNRCVICKKKNVDAHHILPRENKILRHNINNGVTLCKKHHRFSREISAHQNSFTFLNWFMENRSEQYKYLTDKLFKKRKVYNARKNTFYKNV